MTGERALMPARRKRCGFDGYMLPVRLNVIEFHNRGYLAA